MSTGRASPLEEAKRLEEDGIQGAKDEAGEAEVAKVTDTVVFGPSCCLGTRQSTSW